MSGSRVPPKIIIDARMVTQIPHGIARYVSRMAEGLSKLRDSRGGLPYEAVFMVHHDRSSFYGFDTRVCRAKFLSPSELIEIPALLKHEKAELYHSPSFSSLIYSPCPWMVTVHDLNHLTYGSVLDRVYYKMVLKRFARRARALLTVSEFSRHELSEWLGGTDYSIEVVRNALDPILYQPVDVDSVLARYALKRGKYFLTLSNSKPHKNVPFLIQSYSRYRSKYAGEVEKLWPLVLSAAGFESESGVVSLKGIEDREGLALLQGAGALVFPSLYEGFGLPPVEAAAIGVPVIVSRIKAHEEALTDLAQDEAIWVDPMDQEGWVNALWRTSEGQLHGPRQESQSKIRSRYDVSVLGQHMDQIYRRVLGLPL